MDRVKFTRSKPPNPSETVTSTQYDVMRFGTSPNAVPFAAPRDRNPAFVRRDHVSTSLSGSPASKSRTNEARRNATALAMGLEMAGARLPTESVQLSEADPPKPSLR